MSMVLISGCGISVLVSTPQGAEYWISEIVARGGVPTFTPWTQEKAA